MCSTERAGCPRVRPVVGALLLVFAMGTLRCTTLGSMIEKKLQTILADDLESVVAEVPPESLADSVYYVITSDKSYDEGKYARLVIVDFHFLRNVDVKMVRKYRYNGMLGMWERFYNEYHFMSDSIFADSGAAAAPSGAKGPDAANQGSE